MRVHPNLTSAAAANCGTARFQGDAAAAPGRGHARGRKRRHGQVDAATSVRVRVAPRTGRRIPHAGAPDSASLRRDPPLAGRTHAACSRACGSHGAWGNMTAGFSAG